MPGFSSFFSTSALLSFHGERALYAPAAAAPSPVTAIAGQAEDRWAETDNGRVLLRMREITVRLCEVPAPAIGDQVTLADGEAWVVESVASKNAGLAVLVTKRPVTREVTHPGYRNKV